MPALRYAWRSLSRSKGFVVVSVLALGLGLGMSTTMFAVLDAVRNPYVAYRSPENLFRIRWWFGRRNPMRPAELYRFFRDNTHSFEAVVPDYWAQVKVDFGGVEYGTYVGRVTPRWFSLMGVRPALGRGFTDSDGEDVAVLGRQQWRRYFGTRKTLDSATLKVDGRIVTVVGVLPRGAADERILMPLNSDVESGSVATYVRPTVRLREGVTREQAADELKALARMLTTRYEAREAPFAFELDPVVERKEELRDIHRAMVGSALAVLLIACVNLAHLMLARGLAKRREFALRMALGASRMVVVRQMFTECAIMTLGGSILGILTTLWGTGIITNRITREVQWVGMVEPQLSWRVFAASALAAAGSAVLFGLVPAIRIAFAVNLDDPLKDDTGTTTGRSRLKYNPLVVTEVAIALVLMMGGGLLLRTVQALQREEPDYDTKTLYSVYLQPRRNSDSVAMRTLRDELMQRVLAMPGVRDAALRTYRQPAGSAVSAEVADGDSSRTAIMQFYRVVSGNYFQVLGLPILKGRNFEPGDAEAHPVAIISALAADRLYPHQDPVGRMIKLGGPASRGAWVPIVGVVRGTRSLEGVERYAPQPEVYVSMRGPNKEGELLVRTTETTPRTVTQLSHQLGELPGITAAWVRPYDADRQASLKSRRFLANVFVTIGVVALGLSMLGLYGVLAYSVNRRMREFAVRVALGAAPRGLLKMVLHDGTVMMLAGIGVGAFAALAVTRWLDAVLVAVLPSDVISLVLCEAVLVVAGLAAALGPARKASRANPMDILRAV